jgi:DTW domain-containing protein YfiP
MRDKSHMEAVERWAEFVRTSPREEWKKAVNVLIDATYQKADKFYKKLEETEKGREILRRLKRERFAKFV